VPVVVLSGEASATDAVTALRLGAADFVEKPPSPERLLTSIKNVLALTALADERAELLKALGKPGHLVGASARMNELREVIARVGPTETVVLVQGETGAGKERVARALHLASGRQGRFVAINCAAIPATLLESELFGHERGAFTGAVARRLGRFEQAQGGTLLLDEVGDMPVELQAKLLRVLEEREIERLGGGQPVRVDVRVVAATHRDLRQAVGAGRFREDLYFRLAVFPLRVPALRERPEDMVPLVTAFAADLAGPQASVTVTPEGELALRQHPWPGNVRELRNFVERLLLLRGRGALVVDAAATTVLAFGDPLPPAPPPGAVPDLGTKGYRELVDDFERALLRAALERAHGNVAAAARLLKADRGNLYRRMRSLGMSATDEE
jgi:DNA-binding NtrC family response regulator